MENGTKKKMITTEQVVACFDKMYELAINGMPKVGKPLQEMVNDYLNKSHGDIDKASKKMINYQLVKCASSGFLTSFGGLLTMPITIPADLASNLYVQMRMAASLALMGGYDVSSDQTRTFVYAVVAGVSISGIFKQFGIKFAQKSAQALVKKIPGKVLIAINKKLGFRFIAKTGTKSLIVLGKAVPVIGGLVGAGVDLAETKIIANRGYKLFIEGKDMDDDEVVDIRDVPDEDQIIADSEVKD